MTAPREGPGRGGEARQPRPGCYSRPVGEDRVTSYGEFLATARAQAQRDRDRFLGHAEHAGEPHYAAADGSRVARPARGAGSHPVALRPDWWWLADLDRGG